MSHRSTSDSAFERAVDDCLYFSSNNAPVSNSVQVCAAQQPSGYRFEPYESESSSQYRIAILVRLPIPCNGWVRNGSYNCGRSKPSMNLRSTIGSHETARNHRAPTGAVRGWQLCVSYALAT
jgi:hypothetical protein